MTAAQIVSRFRDEGDFLNWAIKLERDGTYDIPTHVQAFALYDPEARYYRPNARDQLFTSKISMI